MKFLCAYSGLEIQVQHMPGYLTGRECCHPIFFLESKHLLSYIHKWVGGQLTPSDTYLLYLALLHSTGVIEWRTAARRHEHTQKICNQHMDSLARIVGKTNLIKHPSFALTHISITHDTATLENSGAWINVWEKNFQDFSDGYFKAHAHDDLMSKIQERERRLEKLIKDPKVPITEYAGTLATWADLVGEFPNFEVDYNGRKMPCNEYWKYLIRCCGDPERIFVMPKADLIELIEHCETNIDLVGSIYGSTLLKLLRKGQGAQEDLLGLSDFEISTGGGFKILPADINPVEEATKLAMINKAPSTEPLEINIGVGKEYPTRLAYLRAKIKWDMAIQYKKDNPNTTPMIAQESTNIAVGEL